MLHRVAVGALAAAAALGCADGRGGGRPSPARGVDQIFDLQAYYQRLGRFAAGDPVPFVGTVAFAAGQGDTATAIVGLSLANEVLSFQREPGGFAARYRIDVRFAPDTGAAIGGGQDEIVRVASFKETRRQDESILFQKVFRLLPGAYDVTVSVRDALSAKESQATASFIAPAFLPGTTSAPILAYQATGRARAAEPLSILLNPRGTVAYGGDTLLAYVEGYRFAGPARVPFEVRTERDSVVFSDSLTFRGGQPVESQVIRLRPDSIVLGAIKLVVGSGAGQRSTSALVSLSQGWTVTNFDEMLKLLRYFADDGELAAMRDASASERAALWREFWEKFDPDPETPENEALNQYFARLAVANKRFRDEGTEGWRTERGEVFITLGEPDDAFEAGTVSQGRVLRWTYATYRVTLFFVDESGFGRFRLTPSSRTEFARVSNYARRQSRER